MDVLARCLAWLATPAIYYSLVSPAYSHAASLFSVALFTFAWFVTRGDDRLRRAALGVVPQLVAWQRIDGSPIVMPQGAGFMRWTEPALWQVLFSIGWRSPGG